MRADVPADPRLGVTIEGLDVLKAAMLKACFWLNVGGPKVGLLAEKDGMERACRWVFDTGP